MVSKKKKKVVKKAVRKARAKKPFTQPPERVMKCLRDIMHLEQGEDFLDIVLSELMELNRDGLMMDFAVNAIGLCKGQYDILLNRDRGLNRERRAMFMASALQAVITKRINMPNAPLSHVTGVVVEAARYAEAMTQAAHQIEDVGEIDETDISVGPYPEPIGETTLGRPIHPPEAETYYGRGDKPLHEVFYHYTAADHIDAARLHERAGDRHRLVNAHIAAAAFLDREAKSRD